MVIGSVCANLPLRKNVESSAIDICTPKNTPSNPSVFFIKNQKVLNFSASIKPPHTLIKKIFNTSNKVSIYENKKSNSISDDDLFSDKFNTKKIDFCSLIDNKLELKLAKRRTKLKIYHNDKHVFDLIPNINKDKITRNKSVNWIIYDNKTKTKISKLNDLSSLQNEANINNTANKLNSLSNSTQYSNADNISYPNFALENILRCLPINYGIDNSNVKNVVTLKETFTWNFKNCLLYLSGKVSTSNMQQIKNLQYNLNSYSPFSILHSSNLSNKNKIHVAQIDLLQAISFMHDKTKQAFALEYPSGARKALKSINTGFNIRKILTTMNEVTEVFDLNSIYRHEHEQDSKNRKNGKHMLDLIEENINAQQSMLIELKPKYITNTRYITEAITPYNNSILKSIPKHLQKNMYIPQFFLLKKINNNWYIVNVNNQENKKSTLFLVKNNDIHGYLKTLVKKYDASLYTKPTKKQLNRNELRCKYRKNAGTNANTLHEKLLMHEMTWENPEYKVYKNPYKKLIRADYAALSAYKAIQKRNEVFEYKRDEKAKRHGTLRFASSYLNPLSTENRKPWSYGNNFNNASYSNEDKARRFAGNFLGGMTQPQDTSLAHFVRTFGTPQVFGDFTFQLGLSVIFDASAQLFADSIQGIAYNSKHNYQSFWIDATAQNMSELTDAMNNLNQKMKNNLSILEHFSKDNVPLNLSTSFNFNNKIYDLNIELNTLKEDIFTDLCKDLQQSAIYMLRHKAQNKQIIGMAIADQFLQNIVRMAWVATIVINPAMKAANLLPGIARLDLLVRRLIQTTVAGVDNNVRQRYFERTNINNPHYIMTDTALKYGLDKFVGYRDPKQFNAEVVKSMLAESSLQQEITEFELNACLPIMYHHIKNGRYKVTQPQLNALNELCTNHHIMLMKDLKQRIKDLNLNERLLKKEIVNFSLNHLSDIIAYVEFNHHNFQASMAKFLFNAEKIHSSISYNASRRTDIVANYISYQMTDYRLAQSYYQQKLDKLKKRILESSQEAFEQNQETQEIQKKLEYNNQQIKQLKQEAILFYQGLEYKNAYKTNPPQEVNAQYKYAWAILERNYPKSTITKLLQHKKPMQAVLHNLKFIFANTNEFFLHTMFRSSNWILMGIDEIGDAIAKHSESLGANKEAQSIVLAGIYSVGFGSLIVGGINSYLDHVASFGRPVGHKTYVMAFIKKIELEISKLHKQSIKAPHEQKDKIHTLIGQAYKLRDYLTNEIDTKYSINKVINTNVNEQSTELNNIIVTSISSLIPANNHTSNKSNLDKLNSMKEEKKHIEKAYKVANNWYRQESILAPITDRLKKTFYTNAADYNNINNSIDTTIKNLQKYVNIEVENSNLTQDNNHYINLIQTLYNKIKSNGHKNNHLVLRMEFIKKMQNIQTNINEELQDLYINPEKDVHNSHIALTIQNLEPLQQAITLFLENIQHTDKTLISMQEKVYLEDVKINNGKILNVDTQSEQQYQDKNKIPITPITINLHEIKLHDAENYDITLTKPNENLFKRSINITKRAGIFVYKHILNPFSRTSIGKHLNPIHKEFLPYYILRQSIIPVVMLYKNLTKSKASNNVSYTSQDIAQNETMLKIALNQLDNIASQINNNEIPKTPQQLQELKHTWLSIYNTITHTYNYIKLSDTHKQFIQKIIYTPFFNNNIEVENS